MELACGLAQEVVHNFGEVRLRVFGTSMVPAVLPGDQILIQRATLEEILPGEIAVFLRAGRLFVHRVVDRKIMNAAASEQPGIVPDYARRPAAGLRSSGSFFRSCWDAWFSLSATAAKLKLLRTAPYV